MATVSFAYTLNIDQSSVADPRVWAALMKMATGEGEINTLLEGCWLAPADKIITDALINVVTYAECSDTECSDTEEGCSCGDDEKCAECSPFECCDCGITLNRFMTVTSLPGEPEWFNGGRARCWPCEKVVLENS